MKKLTAFLAMLGLTLGLSFGLSSCDQEEDESRVGETFSLAES